MNLMPQVVEYTLARHCDPSMLKLMKLCMIDMFWQHQRIIFPVSPQLGRKLIYKHCEVHCNMIIFMLCHCVVDYSDIQKEKI